MTLPVASRAPLASTAAKGSRTVTVVPSPRTDSSTASPPCIAASDLTSARPSPVAPRAQAAHQMAALVFRNLRRLVRNQPLRSFVYHDHGSLVSLSHFSTVGSLMGNLVGGRMAVEGRIARFVYVSLYRMHLIAIHGWLKGLTLILVGHVNQIIRPKLKLH